MTPSSPASRLWMVWALPALLSLLLFAPAIGFDFINYDDNVFVYANPHVTSGFSFENLRWAFTAVHEQWWLPVLWMSYMADSSLLGTAPWGYHLVNVLLHAANAGLLGWVLFRTTSAKWQSILVAALFAAHPLRIEAVAWVTARKDVLSGLFFMLGLLAYVRHVERPSASRLALVFIILGLGLMSKGILVVFPFLLLLLDFWPLQRLEMSWTKPSRKKWIGLLVEKLPLFVLAGIFIAINLHTHVSGTGEGLNVPVSRRMALIPGNIWSYLGLMFWPAHLSVIYPEQDTVRLLAFWAAGLGLAGVTGFCLWKARRHPYLLMGWLWFLVTLFPVVRGIRLGYAAYADRFTYLPSIGLAMALVWRITQVKHLRIGWCILLLLLAASSLQTARILPAWKNSIQLFTYSRRATPDSPVVLNNLGSAWILNQKPQEAVEPLTRATSLKPDYLPAWVNLALALQKSGRSEESREAAWQGLAQGLDFPLFNLELALFVLGKGIDNPLIPEGGIALNDLGRYMEMGSPPAFFLFRELSREINSPARREIDRLQSDYLHRWQTGSPETAFPFFLFAIAATPDDVSLLNNLAWLLATDPQPPLAPSRALQLARRANHLSPPEMKASVLDTLAASLAAAGQYGEAQRTAQQALDLACESGDQEISIQIERRLAAYAQGLPWREAP